MVWPQDFQIKTNEELFREFKSIEANMDALKGIVQNDHPGSDQVYEVWCNVAKTTSRRLQVLIEKTMKHVEECRDGDVPF